MENNFQLKKWVLIVLFGICGISAYAQTPDTDLTTHEPTTVPSGVTFEWRLGPTSSFALVGTPTAVQPGLYYGYYNFGANCFSEGAPIRIITNSCPTTTVSLISAVDAPTGTESFHSGLPVSDANEITGTAITEATPATYFVAFKSIVDSASCYSAANPIVVVETSCSCPGTMISGNAQSVFTQTGVSDGGTNAVGMIDGNVTSLNNNTNVLALKLEDVVLGGTLISIRTQTTNAGNTLKIEQSIDGTTFTNLQSFSYSANNTFQYDDYMLSTADAEYIRITMTQIGGRIEVDGLEYEFCDTPLCDLILPTVVK